MKKLLIICFILACNNQGPKVDKMVGDWCIADSSAQYTFEDLTTNVTQIYTATVKSTYTLHFNGLGSVVSTGEYLITITTLGATNNAVDTVKLTLPVNDLMGQYEIGEAYLRFWWPFRGYGEPTWFWEIARHPLGQYLWNTQLDDNEGTWRIYVRLTWRKC